MKMNSHMAPFVTDVLGVVFFLLGDSPFSEFYVLMLQNTVISIFIESMNKKNNWIVECKI
jgi:hypothetical protein